MIFCTINLNIGDDCQEKKKTCELCRTRKNKRPAIHTSFYLRKSDRIRSRKENDKNQQQPEKRANIIEEQLTSESKSSQQEKRTNRENVIEMRELRINLKKNHKMIDGLYIYV